VSDAGTVVLALATAAGAWLACPVPLIVALVVVAAAVVWRWAVVAMVAAPLLAMSLSHRAWAGLAPPAPVQYAGMATLLTDPEPVASGLRVEVKVGRRHVEAWAHGAVVGALRSRLAGERVEVEGRLRPVSPAMAGRLARRHIAAQLALARVASWSTGPLPVRVANGVRRTLVHGASHMRATTRSLFAGFVLGDDREQPEDITNAFRASGLTHLLVVSGENVAFVIVLAGPLLRRLSLRGRLVAGLLVLALFGLVTRWEPSVLRAEAMAALALAASTLGRPVSTIRLLALAVTGLLLVDPMLVTSVGFLMSVGACSGIALLARPIADGLPGPRPLAEATGVTLAAQLGVAPVLVPVFGPMPLAAIPANLLAVPAAGPIMVWGMTAGLVAGLVPAPLASLLHLPTRVLIGWVAFVARTAAGLPVGHITSRQLVAVALAVAVLGLRSRHAPRARRADLRPGHAELGDGDPQPHA
jgi:competence protein ComEC